jgi:hypothetical protein
MPMEKPTSNETHEIIIIGGGLSGLACGALLAKKGHEPLILEMNAAIGGRALGTSEDGFLYDYFPIGLTPVRGHRLELLATELGRDKDHFKVIGPKKMAFGYRRPDGSWKVLNDVNILLGKSDEPYDPTHLFDLWDLPEGERAKAVAILADIFLKAPDEIRKLDEEDITFQQHLDRMSYDMPSPVFNFLAFFANMAMVEPIDLVSAAEYIRIVQDSFNNGGGGYPEGSMMRVSNRLREIFEQHGEGREDLHRGWEGRRRSDDGGRRASLIRRDQLRGYSSDRVEAGRRGALRSSLRRACQESPTSVGLDVTDLLPRGARTRFRHRDRVLRRCMVGSREVPTNRERS